MIKTLFVNGCSWTEGHMLHIDPEVSRISAERGYVINDMFSVGKRRSNNVLSVQRDIQST